MFICQIDRIIGYPIFHNQSQNSDPGKAFSKEQKRKDVNIIPKQKKKRNPPHHNLTFIVKS